MKILTVLLIFFLLYACRNTPIEIGVSEDGYILYEKAEEFLARDLEDSAFLAFDEARNIFLDQRDSLNIANCLINMSIIQNNTGDYFGAQETALQATDYLNEKDSSHHVYLSTNYNCLGVTTEKLNDLVRAAHFYEKAIRFSKSQINTLTYRNNVAIIYQKLSFNSKALEIYDDILPKSKPYLREYARFLSNFARTKWLIDTNYNAVPQFLSALKIRTDERDLLGQNATLAHLSDYYTKLRPDSALHYAKLQYAVAKSARSPDDQKQALERIIAVESQKKIKPYFETYRNLNDSIQRTRAAAKNQFALIRYEVEKNKADNLRLQKDNAEHAIRLTRQRAATGSVALILLIVISGGTLYYKKRKQRLELESQNKIKESQLKTSRKVHDVVANGIYRVMTEIEYRHGIDREGILIKLDDMYRKSRDISYEAEEAPPLELPYNQKVADLLQSFANENQRVLIVGNETELWDSIKLVVKEELMQLLQEFMVNMKKHSNAENVVLRFEGDQQQLRIQYKDDGVGFSKNTVHGNGLNNTGNRIKNLNGHITFASEPGKGLTIKVSIPIA